MSVLRAAVTVAAVALLLLPCALRAQDHEAALRSVAAEVARAWGSGDVQRLVARLDPDGVGLYSPGASHPTLSVRLARAALEDLHAVLGAGPADLRQVRLLGGSPARGFVEITWRPTAAGMTEAVRHTVFVGLRRSGDAWTVVEIRVLPDEKQRSPHIPHEDRWP